MDADAELEGKCGARSRHFQGVKRRNKESGQREEGGIGPAQAVLADFVRRKRQRAAQCSDQDDTAPPPTENLTEMEKQVVALKKRYSDMLLLFECGYRMRFFGDDAENASKVLGIRVQRHRAFMEASVPVQRALHHARRLVAAGFKIGIVKQLSVASTPHQLLERDVVEVYTRATIPDSDDDGHWVGDREGDMANTSSTEWGCQIGDTGVDVMSTSSAKNTMNDKLTPPRFILAIVEETVHNKRLFVKLVHTLNPGTRSLTEPFESIRVGLFGYDIHSGESVFDEFEDGGKRTRLLEWLSLIDPVEFVLPVGGVSPQTEQVLGHFSCQEGNDTRTTAARLDPSRPLRRIERIVVKGELEHTTDASSTMSEEGVVLPELVRACSSAMESYLRSLKFDMRLSPDAIRPPQDHHHMRNAASRFYLSPTTQNDLAVINEVPSPTFGQHDGSLFSMMNHTRTVFGARLLKNWLLFPQRSIRKIEERQDCVELLSCVSGEGAFIYEALREEILPASAATERLLQQLHLRRATPKSVFRLLRALHRVEKNISHLIATTTSSSTAVHKLLLEYPRNSEALEAALQSIVVDTAHNTDTEYAVSKAWARHPSESRQYEDIMQKIGAVEQDFQAILVTYRHTLNLPTLAYTSHRSSGIGKTFAHLIAVNRADLKTIPDDWLLVSSTKAIVRYYPPRVRALQLEQDVLTEQKAQLVALVWQKTLAAVDSAIYMKGIRSVDTLAQLDCFASLATVTRLFPNYVRPSFATTSELTIVGGRHPTLELLSPQGCSYIPGDVALNGAERGEVMIVSGPNMGGKSTMLRMVALLVLMAQMGSFVPATSLTLSPFDAIHTRMHRRRDANATGWSGAGDDELLNLSAVTKAATSKSLVLLDEVGYGLTSQQARSLAFHIVKHLVKQVRCRVLMATHLVDIVQRFFDNGFSHKEVQSKVLAHQVDRSPSSDMDPTTRVVYHYTTRDGVANKSLALQVASASGLPEAILNKAAEGCWWQTASD